MSRDRFDSRRVAGEATAESAFPGPREGLSHSYRRLAARGASAAQSHGSVSANLALHRSAAGVSIFARLLISQVLKRGDGSHALRAGFWLSSPASQFVGWPPLCGELLDNLVEAFVRPAFIWVWVGTRHLEWPRPSRARTWPWPRAAIPIMRSISTSLSRMKARLTTIGTAASQTRASWRKPATLPAHASTLANGRHHAPSLSDARNQRQGLATSASQDTSVRPMCRRRSASASQLPTCIFVRPVVCEIRAAV